MEEDDDDDGDGGQRMKRSLDSPEASLIGRFRVFFVTYQLPPTLVSFSVDGLGSDEWSPRFEVQFG